MRTLWIAIGITLLAAASGQADQTPEVAGWTVTVRELEGSERRPWYLALVFHKTPKVVTMVVAPAATAGDEGAGIDVERIDRSAIGDVHQIRTWAERLRREAEGWKRPSLRERPPASSHVVGVVGRAIGTAQVENAEHGGGALAVGDFLFAEDVLASGPEASVTVQLVGKENLWHYRNHVAALRLGAETKVGLRLDSEALALKLHRGDVEGRTDDGQLALRTDIAAYALGPEATFLLSRSSDDRLDLRQGTARVVRGADALTLAGGSTLMLAGASEPSIRPLDETTWKTAMPAPPACSRAEALSLVDRLAGTWRGQPLNAQLILRDDGTWKSYERQPGRSVNKGGSWEPRPGGLVELSYIFTPYRTKVKKTDVYRYVLDGHVLRRLVPGGPVYLKQ